jgi:hypothetical protein
VLVPSGEAVELLPLNLLVNQEPNNYANVSYRGVFSGAVSDEIRAPLKEGFL